METTSKTTEGVQKESEENKKVPGEIAPDGKGQSRRLPLQQ